MSKHDNFRQRFMGSDKSPIIEDNVSIGPNIILLNNVDSK